MKYHARWFIAEKVTNCYNIKTIYVNKNSDLSKLARTGNAGGMFGNCNSIVGGAGTTFSQIATKENPYDIKFAHIDGGPDNPGYFTLKQ